MGGQSPAAHEGCAYTPVSNISELILTDFQLYKISLGEAKLLAVP